MGAMRAVAATLVRCALLVSTCLASTGRAAADAPAAPALSWSRTAGTESCIAGPELAKNVEAQLGRPILVALPQAQLNVEGSVAAAEAGYHVHLRLSDPSGSTLGERTLVAVTSDCRALDPLLVFLIALMLDPDAPLLPPRLPEGLSAATLDTLSDLFAHEPSVPPLELARPAAGAPASSPDLRADRLPMAQGATNRDDAGDAAEDGAHDDWRLGLLLEGVAAIGLLPGPTGGARLSLVLTPSAAIAFRAGGAIYPENAVDAGGAGFTLVQGELAACPRLAALASTLALSACIRVAAGALLAEAEGTGARDPIRPAVHAGAGPELTWNVSTATAMYVGVSVAAPFIRDRFFLNGDDGRDEVFRMSQVTGQANVAVAVDFL
jgi:hypothetical protein